MFTLYNRELKRFFKHPTNGLWASDDLKEAQSLLESVREYVKAIGCPEIVEHLSVVEINSETIE